MYHPRVLQPTPGHLPACRLAPQSTDESDNPAAGGGSHPTNGGRGRLSVDDEDLEGGLDEDWGHDVNVIELQNRLPDTSSSRGGGKSKPKSKRSKGAAAEVEAAAAAAAAQEETAAAAAPSGNAASQVVAGVAV